MPLNLAAHAHAIRRRLAPLIRAGSRNIQAFGIIPLLAFFASAILIWSFIELADEVVEGDSRAIDRRIVLTFRHPDDPTRPIGPSWLAEAALEITALGSTAVLVLVSLVTLGYLLLAGWRRAALFVFMGVASGQAMSSILKAAFGRDRPDVPSPVVVHTSSFPSGHAMLAAIVWLTIAALLARHQHRKRSRIYILATAIVVTVLVGVTRVYLGVHYPTDVLAGWSAGAAWACLWWGAARVTDRARPMRTAPRDRTDTRA